MSRKRRHKGRKNTNAGMSGNHALAPIPVNTHNLHPKPVHLVEGYYLGRTILHETTFVALQKALGAIAAKRGHVFAPYPFRPCFNYVRPRELYKVFGADVDSQQLHEYIKKIHEKGLLSSTAKPDSNVALAESLWQTTTASTSVDGIFQIRPRFYCPDVAGEIDTVRADLAPQFAGMLHESGNISLCVGEMQEVGLSEHVATRAAVKDLFHLIPKEVSLAPLDVHYAAPDSHYGALLLSD